MRFGSSAASSMESTMSCLSSSLSSPSSFQYMADLEQWWGASSTFQVRSSASLLSKMRFRRVGEVAESMARSVSSPSSRVTCMARLVSLRSPASSSLNGAWMKALKMSERSLPSTSHSSLPGTVMRSSGKS